MDGSTLFQWEWLIIKLLVLGLLGFDLWRTRREMRRDAAMRAASPPEHPGGA